jgi:hypothetical protein
VASDCYNIVPEIESNAQLTQEIIDAAIEGFEMRKKRIDEQIVQLRAMSDGSSAAVRSQNVIRTACDVT